MVLNVCTMSEGALHLVSSGYIFLPKCNAVVSQMRHYWSGSYFKNKNEIFKYIVSFYNYVIFNMLVSSSVISNKIVSLVTHNLRKSSKIPSSFLFTQKYPEQREP